jgi:hypothetical protein
MNSLVSKHHNTIQDRAQLVAQRYHQRCLVLCYRSPLFPILFVRDVSLGGVDRIAGFLHRVASYTSAEVRLCLGNHPFRRAT